MNNLAKKIATLHIQAKSYDRIIYSDRPMGSFRNVRQVEKTRSRPKPKGLWYACDKDWKEYVQRDNPHWASSYQHKYLLQVNLNRMCVIRTEKELLEFHRKYGIEIRGDDVIDWVAVSKDYDGIEICPYQSSQRNNLDWYYPWDVASGCIWGSGAFKGVTEVENDIKDNEFKSPFSSLEEEDDWEDWD